MDGRDLKLNGAGVRYKAVFPVYSSGLYLIAKKSTAADVYATPGPKSVRLVFQRKISSDDFAQTFMDAILKNSDKAESAAMMDELLKVGRLFGGIHELKKGDVVTLDLIPGTGTVFALNGKQLGEALPAPSFYNALLRTWLGAKAADAKLKRAMLGEVQEAAPAPAH